MMANSSFILRPHPNDCLHGSREESIAMPEDCGTVSRRLIQASNEFCRSWGERTLVGNAKAGRIGVQ